MPSSTSGGDALLATVTRSGRVESWHRGAVAVWHGSDLLFAHGDPSAPVVCRSATKPLQALPFLERGLAERLALTDAEVAVMCASHDGTEAHVACVRSLLKKGGLHEGQLGCGPHAPFDSKARQAMFRSDEKPKRVHNNCSGKHSGFLCLARDCGDDLARYLEPRSRSQTIVAEAVASATGVDPLPERAVDGCGAPTFVLPLAALARGFARLVDPDLASNRAAGGAVRAAACARILEAVRKEPAMLAGQGRLCTALLRSVPSVRMPKNGAEGVYAVALGADPARARCPGPVGIAVKVADGADRGYFPVVVDLLRHLGALPGGVPSALQDFHCARVRNTRDQDVGEIRCAVAWERP